MPAANHQDAAAVAAPAGRSRQSATAAMVYTILSDRARGAALKDTLDAHSFPKGTVTSWRNPNFWQYRNLPDRLAKMPDYPLFRDRLNVLARSLGFTTKDLPQPCAGRRAMDAHALKAMLQTLVDLGVRRGATRGQNAGALGTVARRTGHKESTIAGWLSVVDGALKKPAAAVARLAGYADVQNDLQQLFRDLGDVQTADSLPVSGEGAIQQMTAALLADALRAIPAEGKVQLWKIGPAVGVGASCLALHIVPADGSLRDVGAVQRLPGYGQNREALAAALAARGLHTQAAALPLPLVDAEQFLAVLRDDLDRIVAAMNALRGNPTMSPRDAAIESNLHPETFTAVIGEGGIVRERAAVHALLTHFEGYLRAGIEKQLDRLHAASLGEPVSAVAESAMKTMTLPPRGKMPAKVLIVRSTSEDSEARRANRLEKVFANNPEQISEPRSYEADRARQMLRWQSTLLKARFPDSKEIQSYYHAPAKTLVVSSNLNVMNTELANQLGRGNVSEMAEALARSDTPLAGRERRHVEKLRAALRIGSANTLPGTPGEVLDKMMSNGGLQVSDRKFTHRGETVDLHAERRIKHHVQDNFSAAVDPQLLGGTMRPCGTCAEDLGFDDTRHRGPFWLSRVAQARIDTPGVIERNVERAIGTRVTRTREGKITIDYDTDSDSDVDEAVQRLKKSAVPRSE
jgi:hypothetical protein